MATFTFAPDRNVPVTLPREGGGAASIVSLNGWQFSAKPNTPYQRRFRVTLHGMRWRLLSNGLFDTATDVNFNARALEQFYEAHELWNPFIFPHQHFGNLTCRFASPVSVPEGIKDSGGRIAPFDISLIQHNPGY